MGMDQMISRFSDQLREAISIGQAAIFKKDYKDIRHVYVAGMGGSGIGGNFVAEFVRSQCPVPYLISKGYDVPEYVGKHTLAITSSYSGNTEETLISLQKLEKAGAQIICIASGGKMIDHAKENGYDYIQLPGGWDSPRACLGFSTIQQLYILNKLDFISNDFESEIIRSANLIDDESDSIKQIADEIANRIYDKTPVIYAEDRLEPVAIRFRQQINENSKMLGWHHVIPEMNHNELVGWKDKREDLAVLVLRHANESSRNKRRIDIGRKIIADLCPSYTEIVSKGLSKIEEAFYLVHLCDWISWFAAEKRNMDAVEIDVIDFLKSELAKEKIDG